MVQLLEQTDYSMEVSPSLAEQLLRAADRIRDIDPSCINLILIKQETLAAFRSNEEGCHSRAAEHLCIALHALINELQDSLPSYFDNSRAA